MADFKEIIRQTNRMCKFFSETLDCHGCPLDYTTHDCMSFYNRTPKEIVEWEREVMKWAAEHPEPIYPTIEDLVDYIMDYMDDDDDLSSFDKLSRPIPAKVAEKLNLVPVNPGSTTTVAFKEKNNDEY